MTKLLHNIFWISLTLILSNGLILENNNNKVDHNPCPFFFSQQKDFVVVNGMIDTHDNTSRRNMLVSVSSFAVTPFLGGGAGNHAAIANDNIEGFSTFSTTVTPEKANIVFVKGIVLVPQDYKSPNHNNNNNDDDDDDDDSTSTACCALYVTCRPDRPDNVPTAILSGTRGKPPPVLTARFESPTFPFEFELSTNNLTPEGSISNGSLPLDDTDAVAAATTTTTTAAAAASNLWWKNDDLIVSARLDSDGVAATRSPDDLVGRSFFQKNTVEDPITIALGDRGAFGKFVTGGGSKK